MAHSIRLLTAAIVAATLTFGVAPASAEGARAPGPVTIGSLASLSGDGAPYGRDQARGSSLAASRFELPGVRLALRGADDHSTPAAAEAAMRRFKRLSVAAIIGPTLSPVAEAADPIAAAARIPVLAATNTTLDISRLATVWRVSLSEEAMIPAAVTAARDRHQLRRAGLLVNTADGYARGAAAVFARAARGAGIELTGQSAYGAADASLQRAVARLLGGPPGDRPQALFVAARSDAAVSALKAIRAADAEIPIVGGNGFNSDEVIAGAGPAAEGLIVSASWNHQIVDPSSRAFARAYRARFDSPPSAFSAQGYASVQIAAAAARAGGGASAAAVLRGLRRLGTVGTVLGPLRFSRAREARYPAAVQVVRDGRFALLPGPTSIRGSWTGVLSQRGMKPFRVWATISHPSGSAGNRVRYSGLDCRGRWQALPPRRGARRFTEIITAGGSDACKGRGTVTLRPTDDPNALRYDFRGGGVTSSGILRRL